MVNINHQHSSTFWQTGSEDGLPEDAIVIEGYKDTMALTQGSDVINVNYESLDEFIKELRRMKKLYYKP